MRNASGAIPTIVAAAVLLSLTGKTNAVELATGLLYCRGDNDPVICCAANVHNLPTTLFDISLYNSTGYVASLNYQGLTPVTVPAHEGRCVRWRVNPGFYRCTFDLPDTIPERVRATLMVLDDDAGILGELEGHPMPALPTCGAAEAPQCNGTCPPGSGYCMYSESSRRCFCGIR